MSNPKTAPANLDFRAVLDGLGQGVLLFDAEDRLVLDNLMARSILGANLSLIRAEGWPACAMLLDSRRVGGPSANQIRVQALRQTDAVRFHTLLGGSYLPCWAAAIYGTGHQVYTMITFEKPDWTALSELMSTFRSEARMAISSTRGHAELVLQLIRKRPAGMSTDQLAQRVVGFTEIMATHMHRLELLMDLLYRLEVIRTDQLANDLRRGRKKIQLDEFVEDFLEELVDEALIDPTRTEDLRDRLTIQIPSNVQLSSSPAHLSNVLHDLLRNAVIYSPKGSPLMLRAARVQQGNAVQIDVIDQGYGIRSKEADRVFAAFQRARQPQVMGEFGYGISLYLARAEIEAMGGRIWYESEENVGSTFSIKLPAWLDQAEDEDA